MFFNGNNIILILSSFLPLTKKNVILVDISSIQKPLFSPSLYSIILSLLSVIIAQYPSLDKSRIELLSSVSDTSQMSKEVELL